MREIRLVFEEVPPGEGVKVAQVLGGGGGKAGETVPPEETREAAETAGAVEEGKEGGEYK